MAEDFGTCSKRTSAALIVNSIKTMGPLLKAIFKFFLSSFENISNLNFPRCRVPLAHHGAKNEAERKNVWLGLLP